MEVTAAPAVTVTLAEAADEFLSSPRMASLTTSCAYAGVLTALFDIARAHGPVIQVQAQPAAAGGPARQAP
jgi:hypothetical protein